MQSSQPTPSVTNGSNPNVFVLGAPGGGGGGGASTSTKKRKVSSTAVTPTLTRSERIAARSRVPIGNLSKLKMVKVIVSNDVYKKIILKRRRSSDDSFINTLLSDENYYRKYFGSLLIRECKNKVKEMLHILLSRCIIDRQEEYR